MVPQILLAESIKEKDIIENSPLADHMGHAKLASNEAYPLDSVTHFHHIYVYKFYVSSVIKYCWACLIESLHTSIKKAANVSHLVTN